MTSTVKWLDYKGQRGEGHPAQGLEKFRVGGGLMPARRALGQVERGMQGDPNNHHPL